MLGHHLTLLRIIFLESGFPALAGHIHGVAIELHLSVMADGRES